MEPPIKKGGAHGITRLVPHFSSWPSRGTAKYPLVMTNIAMV